MKENAKKRSSKLLLIVFLLIVVLCFIGGYCLGSGCKGKDEKEDTKGNDLQEVEKILGKEAYRILTLGDNKLIYSGEEVDFTKISSKEKFAWDTNLVGDMYNISYCTQDGMATYISVPDFKSNSLFEDTSYIDSLKNTYSGIGMAYSLKYFKDSYYKDGAFEITNMLCGDMSGYFEEMKVKSAKLDGNNLTLKVAYILNEYDDKCSDGEYNVYDSRKQNNLIKKCASNYKVDDGAEYEFTFKIADGKLYPLSVKKN